MAKKEWKNFLHAKNEPQFKFSPNFGCDFLLAMATTAEPPTTESISVYFCYQY